MSTFSVPIEIGVAGNGRWERIDALVDTGASYTSVPRDVLVRLGIQPQYRRRFRIADEGSIEREVGEARTRLNGAEMTTPVIFGEPGGTPLLGAVTLAVFGLAVDPLGQRLVPEVAWR
jgi:clan AA aspartic protease